MTARAARTRLRLCECSADDEEEPLFELLERDDFELDFPAFLLDLKMQQHLLLLLLLVVVLVVAAIITAPPSPQPPMLWL